MLELKLIDQKCEIDINGKRPECLAEMAIAFEALIKVREVKTRDESKD